MRIDMAECNRTTEGSTFSVTLQGVGKGAGKALTAGGRTLLPLTAVAALLSLETMALTLMEPVWAILANFYLLPFGLFCLAGLRGDARESEATAADEE